MNWPIVTGGPGNGDGSGGAGGLGVGVGLGNGGPGNGDGSGGNGGSGVGVGPGNDEQDESMISLPCLLAFAGECILSIGTKQVFEFTMRGPLEDRRCGPLGY